MVRVFCSYSSADGAPLAKSFQQALIAAGHHVWMDATAILPGDSVPLAISSGIGQSEHFLLLISPAYLVSEWCKRELAAVCSDCINHRKRLIIVAFGDVEVPHLLSDLRRVAHDPADPSSVHRVVGVVLDFLADKPVVDDRPPSQSATELAKLLIGADQPSHLGQHLLPPPTPSQIGTLHCEGLVLVKPGGTFNQRCLQQLLARILKHGAVCQLRVFSGDLIREQRLFEQHYSPPTKIASGELPLSDSDLDTIDQLYGNEDFERHFGTPYRRELIMPALQLIEPPYNVPVKELAEAWESGRRAELWHNGRYDGLNKIGYQKSVFPVALRRLPIGEQVKIVLNGFIPSYRNLFTNPSARVVAVHVRTDLPWQHVRDFVVGGDSSPASCEEGSIRRDAANGLIHLDPPDSVVNGQRNVCHSSATLLDGMAELRIWFNYHWSQTKLGQILHLEGIDPETAELKSDELTRTSWVTRQEQPNAIIDEYHLLRAKHDMAGDKDRALKARLGQYAQKCGRHAYSLEQDRRLTSFIDNGIRLRHAGLGTFLRQASKVLRDQEDVATLWEVARAIREECTEQNIAEPDEIVAEALRICAGDLAYLRCPAYARELQRPRLFRALVIGQLAEEALGCALRTRSNLIQDHAQSKKPGAVRAERLADTAEWRDFLNHSRGEPIDPVRGAVAAVVLCGGRSTRMASTLPKPILPFNSKLLFGAVREAILMASNDVEIFAAVGFRSAVVRAALGNVVRFLEYEKTLGLGFRVATCLHMLRQHQGVVLVAYADMPRVSPAAISKLLALVQDTKTFAFIETEDKSLSGHIVRKDGQITRVIQARLDEESAGPGLSRDFGVYAFNNTPEFREVLLSISNDNRRHEFIFADVIERLVTQGWRVETCDEKPSNAYGVNSPSDLISVALDLRLHNLGQGKMTRLAELLSNNYHVPCERTPQLTGFQGAVDTHIGPLHFFRWWDELWQRD